MANGGASAFTDAFEGMIGRDGEVIPAGRGYDVHDMERWAPESRKSQQRTAFQRDRARLTHSSALRRLGAKTQVLVAGTDDFARTRLTHTLEVAQIGRQIATVLGCDPDVVDCACLAHDLGHPPFGHNGEAELARLAQGIGGFEGNAQTLRLLTRLEPKVFFPDDFRGDVDGDFRGGRGGAGTGGGAGTSGGESKRVSGMGSGSTAATALSPLAGRSAGLNLTRACLDAAVKYPWDFDEAQRRDTKKFCVYPQDREVFAWLKRGAPPMTLPVEAQVMDLSDDIAYSVHDVEDAVATGAFDPAAMADPHEVEAVVESTRSWCGAQWDADELEAALLRLHAAGAFVEDFDGSRRSLAHLKNVTSDLIGRFAASVEEATRAVHGPGRLTRYAANVIVPQATRYEITALKGIAAHYVMIPRSKEPFHTKQRRIVADLVGVLMQDAPRPSSALDPVFVEDWRRAANDGERLRVAIDQVASLTDVRAITLHSVLFG